MKILIALDRSSDRAAELIEGQTGFVRQALVPGVEVFGAEVLEQAAVPLVGAGAAEQVHLTADHVAVLGRRHAFDRVNLLNGLDAHDVDQIGLQVIRGVTAFGVSAGIGAINCIGHAVLSDAVHPHTLGRHRYAGVERQKVGVVAPEDRQLRDLGVIEGVQLLGRNGVDQRRRCLDAHSLSHGADFHDECLAYILRRRQLDAFALEAFESFGFDSQRVAAYAQEVETASPAGLVVLVAAEPVPSCVNVIVASGIDPPEESVTIA